MQIITTHNNTDFDGLASMIAGILLYPNAIPVLPRQINPNVKGFLSIHKDLFNAQTPDEIELDEVESLIVVDTNSWNRLDQLKKLKNKDDLEIIMWDHHLFGDIHPSWKCQEEIGATITLMIRELKKRALALSPMFATLFLTGLYEDTGSLMFPLTKPEDAYAAAYLMENKADLTIVSSILKPAYGEKQKAVLFEMLKSAKRIRINGHKFSICKIDVKGHVYNLAVVVNMYREILNVDAAFGIFTDRKKGRNIVIGRSIIDSLNIGKIMRSMGGGGHPGAGTAMLKSVKPKAIEELIIELIKGDQLSTVQISDIMSYPVFTIDSSTKMEQVTSILKEKGCTGFPVVEDQKIVGIISRRDLSKVRNSQLKAPVKAFMIRDIISIEPGKNPMDAARLMVKHDIGRLPVLDNGKLIGIITRSDTMLYFYDLLPE